MAKKVLVWFVIAAQRGGTGGNLVLKSRKSVIFASDVIGRGVRIKEQGVVGCKIWTALPLLRDWRMFMSAVPDYQHVIHVTCFRVGL
jgi:hypothetical protein